jgi:hypothetical protein
VEVAMSEYWQRSKNDQRLRSNVWIAIGMAVLASTGAILWYLFR